MVQKYKCAANEWLVRLYGKRKQWCTAYSKAYRENLSSQRSETTNRHVSHRLRKFDGLCEFYKHFIEVVDDRRNVEYGDDFKSKGGSRVMIYAHVKLPKHDRELYTREVAFVFEQNFINGSACC